MFDTLVRQTVRLLPPPAWWSSRAPSGQLLSTLNASQKSEVIDPLLSWSGRIGPGAQRDPVQVHLTPRQQLRTWLGVDLTTTIPPSNGRIRSSI